ncbi:MAG: RsmE family RNA methyltransferase, partial [Eggerthellaceae bacterium]|nr:RsmE family RNA methyltransferase [Eggerthellaceae bacterium]
PCSLGTLCKTLAGLDAVFICWEQADKAAPLRESIKSFSDAKFLQTPLKVGIVIGPEGGLEETEVQKLLASNPKAFLISLGSYILRVETAALAAVSIVAFELGNL